MINIEKETCHQQFGRFIREARERFVCENRAELGLYQSEVAERVGITQSYYSRIESGKRDVDLALALRICKVLNVDPKVFVEKFL